MRIKMIFLLLLAASIVNAQVKDKWRINLGTMYVTDFSTQMQISPKGIPLGVILDTKDNLGMDYSSGVFRLDGYYRFNDSHSMSFSYFAVRSNGSKSITKDLDFEKYNISAGANVSSYFNMDVYKVNYGYSFYHNDKVELLLSAGLHITSIDLGLTASGSIRDTNGNVYSSIGDTGASITIPLPVVGFKGSYTIIDDTLFVLYQAEYFRLKVDSYNGSLISSTVTLDYRFYENYGVGLGYNTNRLNLNFEDNDNVAEVTNSLDGFMFNISYTY